MHFVAYEQSFLCRGARRLAAVGFWRLAFGAWRLAGAPFAFGERSAIPSSAFPREDFPHVGDEQFVFPPRRGQGGEHAFALGEQAFPQRGIFDDADDFSAKSTMKGSAESKFAEMIRYL